MALAALLGLLIVVLLVFAVGGGGHQLSPREQLRADRAANPVHLTVSVSGDLLIHSPLWLQALANGGGSTYDFAPMLAPIKPVISAADLAFCHIETPLGDGPPSTYPLFRAPSELAQAVKETGWDACDTASNHSLDYHLGGIADTADALDAAGIPHTGSFATPQKADQPLIMEAKGVKVGYVAYTDQTNGIPPPTPWSINLAASDHPGQVKKVLADAKAASAAGAEAVIVTMQWGTENSSTPNASQKQQAAAMTASKYVTAVVGSGPHVVQPIEKVNDKFVVYSEGNLISNEDAVTCPCPAASQDGMIVNLDLVIDGSGAHVAGVHYVPIWVDHSDYSVLPVGDALKNGLADAASLKDSYDRTTSVAGQGPGVEPDPPSL